MTNTTRPTIEPGCIVDSHHGWRGHCDMIRFAVAFGFAMTADEIVACIAYESGAVEVAEEAGG